MDNVVNLPIASGFSSVGTSITNRVQSYLAKMWKHLSLPPVVKFYGCRKVSVTSMITRRYILT